MKFSIIVPVYNVESYIEQCIHSLLAQKQVETQIILVDDGSTDTSGVICDQYAHKYKQIQVVHQDNRGLSEARNAGIKQATGDYILFVDSDDYIAKNALPNIEQEIVNDAYPDLIFLECKKVILDQESHIKSIPMQDGVTASIRSLNHQHILEYISNLPKYPASAWAKAIKRDLFLKHDLLFESGLLHEDLEWAVRLFLVVDSAGYCSTDYYFYRQNRTNSISSGRSEQRAMDMLHTVEKWTNDLKNDHSSEEKRLIKSLMEYVFRFLLINVHFLPRHKHSAYKQRVHACDAVLGTRNDLTSKFIRVSYKAFGINITGWLLQVYLKMRTLRYSINFSS